jgi:hypothetical protein
LSSSGLTIFAPIFDPETRKLIINEQEALLVKRIFDEYINGTSTVEIAKKLNQENIRTKTTYSKSGRKFGDSPFHKMHISALLNNIIYMGKVQYAKELYDGEHDAIISEELFEKTQKMLQLNRVVKKASKYSSQYSSLLRGLIYCDSCGKQLFHTYTIKKNKVRYRYYTCTTAQKSGFDLCQTKSISADSIEHCVVEKIIRHLQEKGAHKEAAILSGKDHHKKKHVLHKRIERIIFNDEAKTIVVSMKNGERYTYAATVRMAQHKTKSTPKDAIKNESRLMQNFLLAHQLDKMFEEGKLTSFKQAADHLGISPARVSQIMQMVFLPVEEKRMILAETTRS